MTGLRTMLSAYDDMPCEELRADSGAARLVALGQCASTMDVVHALAAEGAPHGTVVVTDAQGAGRGRSGKAWASPPGSGVWTSVLLRTPVDAPPGVLSLRVGLALASALDGFAVAPVQLKWPNDLFVQQRKLAGILTEARWRGDMLEWTVVGVGVNVLPVDAEPPAASLPAGTRRGPVLSAVVRAVLEAASRIGELGESELSAFAARDLAVGRAVSSPLDGVVQGITPRGAVRIRTADGDVTAVAGSLVFRTSLAE